MITKTKILQFYCLPGTVLVITTKTRVFTKSFFFKDESPGSRVFLQAHFRKSAIPPGRPDLFATPIPPKILTYGFTPCPPHRRD